MTREPSYRGSRAAAWVVAATTASGCSEKMRRMADLRGDGTADDVEIQWCIDSLPD